MEDKGYKRCGPCPEAGKPGSAGKRAVQGRAIGLVCAPDEITKGRTMAARRNNARKKQKRRRHADRNKALTAQASAGAAESGSRPKRATKKAG